MRDQKVGKLCAKVRKVNNFAAAGNEGLGPPEDLEIEWRQIYAVAQCPRTDLNKRFLPRPKTTTA